VKEQTLFILFLGLVSFIVGCFHLYLKNGRTRWMRNAICAVFMLSLFLLGGREQTLTEFGVVLVPEISVYSGFERDHVLLFQVHEGVEFDWSDRVGKDWIQIKLADGKKGWVSTEGIVFEPDRG
jgi:hypothetical protein